MLLEDALLLGDHGALAELFEDRAVLEIDGRSIQVRRGKIGAFAAQGAGYLADPTAVLQTRNIALVVTASGANVARRGADGSWRYEIVRFRTQPSTERSSNEQFTD